MSKQKWTDQDFANAVRESFSYAQVIKKLHLRVAGSNYDTVKRKIQELHLDISHMTGQGWNKGERHRPLQTP
ncbi:MAG: hypothetical protein K5660_04985 [Paludibacteraceae bacterium]|nr:hypothetical protein [Paludibacteraceae bacterium]